MRYYYVLFLSILLVSCNKDDTAPINKGNLNEVITGLSTNTNVNSTILNYTIGNNSGTSIQERGVSYSTSINFSPTQNIVGIGGYPGNYSIQLLDLIPQRTYYWKPYTKTVLGTNYGNVSSFTTQSIDQSINNGNVAFIPFNGDLVDYSSSGNNLVGYSGFANFGIGKFGGINSSSIFNSNFGAYKLNCNNFPTGSMSMTFWFKPNSLPATLVSVGSNGGGTAFSTATVKIAARNRLFITHWNFDRVFDFPQFDFLDGSWYFVAFTYDSNSRKCFLAVYRKPINSSITGGYTSSYVLSSNLNWSNYKNIAVGCLPLVTRNYELSEQFNGQIDDFRLFNKTLTLDEISYFSGI